MKKNLLIFGLIVAAAVAIQTQAQCYTKAYATGTNLILDPGFDSTTIAKGGYGGWGVTGTPGFVTNSAAYCGRSMFIRGTCYPNGGSLDRALGTLKALTKYRLRAMVNSKATIGKAFQFQVEGVNGSTSIFFNLPNTNGWKQVDTTFTTGATLGGTKGMYFNSCGSNSPLITDTCYLDNYELFTAPKIYASPASLTFLGAGSKKVAVRGETLTQGITITASTGFTVSPTTMLSTVSGATTDSLSVTYAGGTSASGYVYFTSGTVKDSLQVTGTVAPSILTNISTMFFDDMNTTGSLIVNGGNLVSPISITAPTGITVSPTSIPAASASNVTVNVTYNGTTSNVTGNIVLTSGTATKNVGVVASKNTDCFIPLDNTLTNLIPSPQMNTLTGFGGWGNKAIVAGEAYCGMNCVKFTAVNNAYPTGAALDVTNIPWVANNKYRFRAMVKAVDGTFAFLASGTNPNFLVSVKMSGNNWIQVDTTFTVGAAPSTSFFTFNNVDGASTGKIAYIDNYELYNITSLTTGINQAAAKGFDAYVSGNKIVAKFDVQSTSNVELSLYNVNGMLLESKRVIYAAGTNAQTFNSVLPSGVYIVKMTVNGKFNIQKVIK
jgi:hypothetical protein